MGDPGFAAVLIAWFQAGHRDLPWRHTADAYQVWVSEVMLQQTQVATVVPYYERFLARFPTLESLAEAPLEELLRYWSGLGYYSRARNFHAAVQQVRARHGGRVPADYDAMRALPGVGAYTAGAVLSIAYDLPLPAVDGNVLRVMSRILATREDIARPATQRRITAAVAERVPTRAAGLFTQALIELGATICTPRSPRCLLCPVSAYCQGFQQGIQDELPVKGKAAAPRPVTVLAAAVARDGRWLIVRRPAAGLFGGLWELPNAEVDGEMPEADRPAALRGFLKAHFGLQVAGIQPLESFTHVLTHRRMAIHPYRARHRAGNVPETEERRWVTPAELATFPFARLQQRILEQL